MAKKAKYDNSGKSKLQEKVTEKAVESIFVAEFFKLMNSGGAWNIYDDEYFVLNRRWFDHWKNHLSYDYIVLKLLEKNNPNKTHM